MAIFQPKMPVQIDNRVALIREQNTRKNLVQESCETLGSSRFLVSRSSASTGVTISFLGTVDRVAMLNYA